ncbi:MAG TPA: hypothetical protein VKA89_07930 [Solirubrobacterales bacterium]|nr:hypothetical protein [Solirubrobacterales bacterium]
MESGKRDDAQRRVSENLRVAVERTFDEVTRRGQEAREVVTQRGQEAREASAGAVGRVAGALEGIRVPTREDLRVLEERLDGVERRLHALETRARNEE